MKTLFIGNSHTYYNDMPYLFSAMCMERGIETETVMLAFPHAKLREHLQGRQARYNIKFGAHDYLILQESQSGFPGADAYLQSVGEFVQMAQAAGSKVILYDTFAAKGNGAQQELFRNAYREACVKYQIACTGTGAAFTLINETHPEIELYDADGMHASLAGSYLVALTLFAKITGSDPQGLTNQIMHNGKPLYEINKDVATALQSAVKSLK